MTVPFLFLVLKSEEFDKRKTPIRQPTDGMTLERAYVIQGEMCSHKTKQEPYFVYPVIMSKKVYSV